MPAGKAPRAGGVSKAPATSRRTLTKVQLDRKRECDREAQRQIREKTKNRIAHLESLVGTLQAAHQDSSRVNELVDQVNANEKEINRLREIIRGVTKLVRSASVSADHQNEEDNVAFEYPKNSESPHKGTPTHVGCIDDQEPEHAAPYELPATTTVSNPMVPSSLETSQEGDVDSPASDSQKRAVVDLPFEQQLQEPPQFLAVDGATHIESASPGRELQIFEQSPEQVAITHKINTIAKQIIHDRTLDGRLWYLAGSLLSFILTMPQKYQTPMEYEEDIPVRAVLHGWGAVAAQYYLDPGWVWLRHLDEELYSLLGVPDRLACMRVMRMQYQAQVRPHLASALPLPNFMEARPVQKFLEHDPLVEHFVWPGLREHILFGPRKYATTKFMDNFRNHTRFLWQHNPEDTFVRDKVTGLYSYSPDFAERQADLRSWSMRPDFFSSFPELRQDIPSSDECPSICQMLTLPTVPIRRRQVTFDIDSEVDDNGTQKWREASLETLLSS